MSKILLIAKRELRAYFSTWSGYIIISAALIIDGLLFNAFAIGDRPKFSSDVLSDFFYFSSGIAIVSAIFLSMRLIAEEKQNGTIVLYYTSPISERQLILGKFLSAFFVFLILQALSIHLPLLIFLEGKVSFGHLFAGYLGLSLLGAAIMSIALFASVIGSNQVIAGVLGACITTIFLVLWLIATKVDQPFSDFLSYASIHNQRFKPFMQGIVHTADIVFYLSIAIFFIECSVRAIESRRQQG